MCCCVRMKLVENLGVSKIPSQIVTLPHVANSISAFHKRLDTRDMSSERKALCHAQLRTLNYSQSQITLVTLKHSILCIFCPIAWNAPELNTRLLMHVLMMCASFGNNVPCGTETRSQLKMLVDFSGNVAYIATHPWYKFLYFSHAVDYRRV